MITIAIIKIILINAILPKSVLTASTTTSINPPTTHPLTIYLKNPFSSIHDTVTIVVCSVLLGIFLLLLFGSIIHYQIIKRKQNQKQKSKIQE